MKNPIYQLTLTKAMVNPEGLSDPLVAILNKVMNGSTELYDFRFWTEEDKLDFSKKWVHYNLFLDKKKNPTHSKKLHFEEGYLLIFSSEEEMSMWIMENL